ncbi:helix-turn-helix domain-containing protein, partial [Desulfosarcina sp. OttesenSCG-928-G10]|nr:helix-turn-helix domain-containing protein [Desulfosarcina sp. OttesenSCG-928-G10]
MISAPDRRKRVELINQARESGVRLAPTCKTAGITARTYERWTKDGDVREDHRPMAMRPVPANKLTPEEEQQILDTCHRPEYTSLPPSQIVPQLADQGIYIASEASFYRVLHKADEQHHRGRSKKPRSVSPPKERCATGPD